jgi:ribose transport system substrate-binding protein
MKKKWFVALSLILAVCMLVAGCAKSPAPSESSAPSDSAESTTPVPTPEPKTYKIGVCAADLSNPYFVTLIDGIQDKADKFGNVQIIVDDPKQDPAKQQSAIENFMVQGVDGIIMIPFDLTSANEALKDVYAEGKVKILCQSGKIESADTNVAARDYDMGYTLGVIAGQYIADEMGGEAQIGMLNYPALESIIQREQGIEDGIKEYAPDAEIVARAQGGTPDAGVSATESMLEANPDISVIVSINDAGALGALSAVESLNLGNDLFFIGGIDALDQALAEIADGGYYKATVDIAPYDNGKYDLELMMKMLNGEDVGVENSVEVKPVTTDNIGDYVE